MKLDFQGNWVRVRLRSGELSVLERTGRVGESVQFGPGAEQRLVYALELSQRVSEPTARFRHGILTITLPSGMATDWIRGGHETLAAEYSLDGKAKLTLHIEKELNGRTREMDDGEEFLDYDSAPPFSERVIPL